jgi:hypothetical protein
MRRLLFLALFVALVAGMGFSQITWGGLFQYGVWSDFSKPAEQAAYGKLMFTDQLDQFNTVVFRFRWKDLNFQQGESIVTAGGSFGAPVGGIKSGTTGVVSADWDIDRFYISTDVTGALGVKDSPVTMKLGFGFQDPNGADLTGGISPFEVADLSGNDVGGNNQATIFPVITIMKMVNVGAIIAPGDWKVNLGDVLTTGAGPYNGQGFEIFANGGMAPIMAEVGYGDIARNNGGNAVWNGERLKFIWGAANFKQTQGDLAVALAVNGQYNVNNDGAGFMLRNHYAAAENSVTPDDVNYGFGVAASVVYKGMITAKAGLVGIEGSLINRAEFQVIAMLDPKFGVDAGGVLNLDSGFTQAAAGDEAGLVNDMDVAARIVLGKAMYRIGWKYIDMNAQYSVMSDDLGTLGDTTVTKTQPGQGVFVEMSLSF